MSISRVSKHRIISTYLALSMGCFGLYTLILSLTPLIGLRNGFSPLEIGVLTATLTGLGLVTDLPLAHMSRRYGSRAIVLWGAILLSFSCSLLYLTAIEEKSTINNVMLWVSTVVSATGFSCLIAPLLGAISTRAQGIQITVQTVNAVVQRIGAFGASLLVGYLFLRSNISSGPIIALLISAAMILLASSLPSNDSSAPAVENDINKNSVRSDWIISPGVKKAMLIGVSVQVYLIAGYAFFPMVLKAKGLEEAVGSALAIREIVAILAAFMVGVVFTSYSLSKSWRAAALIGAVSLAVVPLVGSPCAVTVLFSVHGAALGIGIVANNVHVYYGTTEATRFYGFACAVMSTRLAGIAIPIMLGSALEVSVDVFAAVIFLFLLVIVILYSAIKTSAETAVA